MKNTIYSTYAAQFFEEIAWFTGREESNFSWDYGREPSFADTDE